MYNRCSSQFGPHHSRSSELSYMARPAVKAALHIAFAGLLCLTFSCSIRRTGQTSAQLPHAGSSTPSTVAQVPADAQETPRPEIQPEGEPDRDDRRDAKPKALRPQGTQEESDHNPDSPDAAAEFFRRKRWPLGGEPPVERYLEARRQARSLRHFSIAQGETRSESASTFGSWQPLGPGNIGGRVRDLVINPHNPQIMYAGSATDGVWKTTNGGQSWAPLTDFLPVLSVSSLAMSPVDPNTLLLGTGEASRGAGIFKSSDGGKTWAQIPSTANIFYVYKLAFSQVRPANVYAATSSGIWISLNGGTSWNQSYPASGQSASCQSLAVRSDQPADIVYANCQSYSNGATVSSVFRNSDAAGAGTWNNVLSDSRMGNVALAVAPTKPATVYAIAVDNEAASPFVNALLAVYRSTHNGDRGTTTTIMARDTMTLT